METTSLSIPSDLSALVSTEVARQVRDLKAELERSIAEVRERTPDDRAALVVFSGDLDRVMAAFVIATGAAAASTRDLDVLHLLGTLRAEEAGRPGRGQGLQAAHVRAHDAKKEIDAMRGGEVLEVLATDPGSVQDFQGWVKTSKLAILREQHTEKDETGRDVYVHVLERK